MEFAHYRFIFNLRLLYELRHKKRAFLYRFSFVQKEIFSNVCVLSQCVVTWMHFRNIHSFTYQKTLLDTLCMILKLSKAFSVSLSNSNSIIETLSIKVKNKKALLLDLQTPSSIARNCVFLILNYILIWLYNLLTHQIHPLRSWSKSERSWAHLVKANNLSLVTISMQNTLRLWLFSSRNDDQRDPQTNQIHFW